MNSPFTKAQESINYPHIKAYITSVDPARFLSFVFFIRHQDKCLFWIPEKKSAFPITSMRTEHNVDSDAETQEIKNQEFSFSSAKGKFSTGLQNPPECTCV